MGRGGVRAQVQVGSAQRVGRCGLARVRGHMPQPNLYVPRAILGVGGQLEGGSRGPGVHVHSGAVDVCGRHVRARSAAAITLFTASSPQRITRYLGKKTGSHYPCLDVAPTTPASTPHTPKPARALTHTNTHACPQVPGARCGGGHGVLLRRRPPTAQRQLLHVSAGESSGGRRREAGVGVVVCRYQPKPNRTQCKRGFVNTSPS